VPVGIGEQPGRPKPGGPGEVGRRVAHPEVVDVDQHEDANASAQLTEVKVAVHQRDWAPRRWRGGQARGGPADHVGVRTPTKPGQRSGQSRRPAVRQREITRRFAVQPRQQPPRLGPR
jgi:hypothetical protein